MRSQNSKCMKNSSPNNVVFLGHEEYSLSIMYTENTTDKNAVKLGISWQTHH